MKTQLMLLAAAAMLASCGGNAQLKTAADPAAETTEAVDMHNAENSLDIIGVYKGTLPAADCPGIAMTLTLNADGTYTEQNEYLERDVQFDAKGRYVVEGNLLTVYPDDSENTFNYRIEEGRLRWLDADKQPIPGEIGEHYILTKTE